jgi:hypothetical protein
MGVRSFEQKERVTTPTTGRNRTEVKICGFHKGMLGTLSGHLEEWKEAEQP